MGRLGCEYRVNGGEWQTLTSFRNLTPDTEYVFEQRWQETEYYAASRISEPLVVRTNAEGPTNLINHERVADYVEANGMTDDQQMKYLAYSIQDQYGADYYFFLTKSKFVLTFDLVYDGAAATNIAFDITFDLFMNTNHVLVKCNTYLVAEDAVLDHVDYNHLFEIQDFTKDLSFRTGKNGDYLTAENVSALGEEGLKLLLVFWDELLYEELGFGMKGLGFTSYEGKGSSLCHPGSGYHIGEIEVRYQRDAACSLAGSNGYEYCTACNSQLSHLGTIPYTMSHTYDCECDAVCNNCGSFRNVRHRYLYPCAKGCAYCGTPREETYADHKLGADGLCTLCGEKGRFPGDVTGDGKVNMGDVARIYAHIKGSTLLTDPDALAAADVSGDGKINLGDTSRLLAHTTGKNPLF